MADLLVHKGKTSKLLRFFFQDTRQSDGSGLTGLVFNTAGLTAYYIREGAASAVQITLATMTVGTWATGGFKEIDATNMPGYYELGIPDAALSSTAGVDSVTIMLKGAANMAVAIKELQLTDFDPNDAVRAGLTALPNVASGSAGAIPTTGTGANQISVASGLVTLAGVTHTGAVIPQVVTVTGNVNGSVGSVTGAVGSVTAGVTVTTNNDKTGYTVSTVSDKTGYTISTAGMNSISANLLATALTELAQAQPSATPALSDAIMLLFMALRNQRIEDGNALVDSICNNAGTVIAKSSITDVAGVTTRAKMVSGP